MSDPSSILPSFHPSTLPLFDESFLRKLEPLALLSRRAMAGQLQGERRSPKRGQSVEFADFRPYARGDDFRRIDWNAYARLERFFVKLFVEEEDLTVHLLVDASRSMNWGEPSKLGYALRAAGALGYVALVGLDRVTATTFGGAEGDNGQQTYFPPHRGKQQAMALFAFLQSLLPAPDRSIGTVGASFPPTRLARPSSLPAFHPSTDPRQMLARYAAQARQPGPLILLSDLFEAVPQPSTLPAHRGRASFQSSNLPSFQSSIPPSFPSSPWSDGLQALAGRGFEVTVLHILSLDEVNPPLSGDLKLVDVETGADVEITADEDLLQRYRDGLAAWQEELRLFCGARGMHYVPVETSLPFEELLFAVLRRRGVLR